jgi:peptidoglycan/LPS O-acetylase OafA/YrhL
LLVAAAISGWVKLPTLTAKVRQSLIYLGALSYPLYAIHYPILILLAATHRVPGVLAIALCLFGAVGVHHAVEVPYARYAKTKRGAKLKLALERA